MSAAPENWPPAVEVLNEGGASDVVLLCEHASNYIPPEYAGLGLSPADLARHIAWDPGAADLTRALSAALDAPAFLGRYSRLLIDLNRPLEVAASILKRSEDTDIPGNREVPTPDLARRVLRIYRPFHDRVAAHVAWRLAMGRPTRVLAVHSFTPVFSGVARPWHAGVLYDPRHAGAFGAQMLEGLRAPSLRVDANVPYRVSRDDDYGIYEHGADRGLPAVIVEVRHDLLGGPEAVADWAGRIRRALAASAAAVPESVPPAEPNGPGAQAAPRPPA